MSRASRAWHAFLTIPDEITRFVEFLSFVYVPKSKKELVRLFDRYMRERDEFPFNIESYLSELRRAGIVESSGGQAMVARDMVEDISCHALAHHRAAPVCEFLNDNFYVRNWVLFLQARWALYSGDEDKFMELAQRSTASRHYSQDYDVLEIVSQGFSQAESFSYLSQDLALLLCERALHLSVNQARPVPGVWAWYRSQSREIRNREAYEHQVFIRGGHDFPSHSHLGPLGQLLQGKLAALNELPNHLPQKGRHPVFPYASQEFIYIVACYAAGRQEAVMEAMLYGDGNLKDWLHWFWEIRTSKSVDLPRQLMRHMADPDYPPMMRFFGYLLLFWAGFEKNINADAVKGLATAYLDAGYQVFGRELAALHACLRGEKRVSTPFLSLLAPTKHWEAKLNYLETWLASDLKAEVKKAAVERLVWVLNPKDRTIQAKIQKVAKKGGWTKGRMVEFHDLEYKAASFLTEADRRVLLELHSRDRYDYGFGYGGFRVSRSSTLEALKEHPHLYLPDGGDLRLSNEEPCFCVTELDDVLQLTLEPVNHEGTDYALKEVDPYHYAIVTFQQEQINFQNILGPDGMELPKSEVLRIQAIFTQVAELGLRIESFLPSTGELETQTAQSKLAIRLFPQGAGLSLEVWSEIDNISCNHPPGAGPRFLLHGIEGKTIQVERDLKMEKALYQDLQNLVPQIQNCNAFLPHPGDCLVTLERLKTLPEESFVLQWPEGKKFQSNTEIQWSDLRVSVFGGKEWFTVETELLLEGAEHLQLSQLLEMQRQQGSRFIKLDENRYLTLTQDLSKRLRALESASIKQTDGRYEIAPLAASVLAESLDLDSEDEAWLLQKGRLQKAQKMKPRLPKGLKAKLRPYQRQGFDWLARSAAWGVGVCLADDMGLGKTVQILSLLLSRSKLGPSLVVAPTSVCSNWRDEVEKFTPTLKVILLHEVDREQAICSVGSGEILVASYGLMCTNLDALKEVSWNTLVLDESQAIKNHQTQRFKAAIALKADFRIAATGTPIENLLSAATLRHRLRQFEPHGM